MAVVDEAWRAVWWPWLLVWAATAAFLMLAVAIVLTHRRRERKAAARGHEISFYLNAKLVMDLYRQHGGRYRAALRQEVQERISRTREVDVSADLSPLQAGARRGDSSEVFRTYVETAEPITVITIINEVLERAGDIVHVDLTRQEVGAGDALDKALRDAPPADGVRLRDVEAFVSILGRFRVTGRTADSTTFEAPFGDPPDPADAPRVRLVCAADGLRADDLPVGPFRARCLGRVEDWNARSATLTVHTIAVFR